MDADIASNRLNELFHLHRYEDCVVFINRLAHSTVKLIISQISIDMYLARLPYTIQIFEALYAKCFIQDPENFPVRHLKPEKIIDKMVAYFSLLHDQTSVEPIDGVQMLESFENVIRIISYVQPTLYSRLLYFKYAIDKGLMRLEMDLELIKKNSISDNSDNFMTNELLDTNKVSKNGDSNLTSLKSALLLSRVTTMHTCESLRQELMQTLYNCDKALNKLNDHTSGLKSQKIFKEAVFYINQHQHHIETAANAVIADDKLSKSSKNLQKSSEKLDKAKKKKVLAVQVLGECA